MDDSENLSKVMLISIIKIKHLMDAPLPDNDMGFALDKLTGM